MLAPTGYAIELCPNHGLEGRRPGEAPIRNALISGVLLGVRFLLARIALLPGWAEIGWYAVVGALGAVCSMEGQMVCWSVLLTVTTRRVGGDARLGK